MQQNKGLKNNKDQDLLKGKDIKNIEIFLVFQEERSNQKYQLSKISEMSSVSAGSLLKARGPLSVISVAELARDVWRSGNG